MDSGFKKSIKQLETWPALQELLQNSSLDSIQAHEVDLIYRNIQKYSEDAAIRIAYLSNHTIDPLPRYTSVASARQGILLSDYVGPFNQYVQAAFNPDSDLVIFNPNIIFLDLSMRELSPQIYGAFFCLTEVQRREELCRIVEHIKDWVKVVKKNTEATVLISNFPIPKFPQAGIADAHLDLGEVEFFYQLNLDLIQAFRNDSRVYMFDLDRILSYRGKMGAYNPKMYYLGKMEWDEESLPVIADEILRYIWALKGETKKCLVVDLDNTLWGGVVGEDGVGGIKIGIGDPEGEAFFEFQQVIRSLKERGILLAVCSKNNFNDAMDVFESRKDMPLGVEDFSSMQINWETKCHNLERIAADLNIGEDSLVFIDDNRVECELIRQTMPHVRTIHLPKDPSKYPGVLRHLFEFEKLLLSDEDRTKTIQYHQNSKRKEYKRELGDVNKFLEGLGTTLTVFLPKQEHIPRIHQLFSKTNQFNLTTKRYGPSEIEAFIEEEAWFLYAVNVADNFGALGLVGACLVRADRESVAIDSFLLSCRVMGRGIETAMMNQIKKEFLLEGKYQEICAEYRKTKKNIPVERFYEQQGFTHFECSSSDIQGYQLSRDKVKIIDCPGIQLLEVR